MFVQKSENLNYTRTTSGAVMLDNTISKVMLVTSLKFPGLWVLPKGGVEEGLTPEENAKKEYAEEAGVGIQLHEKIYDEVLHYPATGTHDEKIQREIFYRASFLSYVNWEEFELRKRQWFDIDAGLASIMSPEQHEAVKLAKVAALLAEATDA